MGVQCVRPFLTARWTDLVILNYEVPPAVVLPLVPRGTELDIWQGQALVSLVGFLFTDTRVHGLAIPGHRHFEEVNLRFYVRRRVASAADRLVALEPRTGKSIWQYERESPEGFTIHGHSGPRLHRHHLLGEHGDECILHI